MKIGQYESLPAHLYLTIHKFELKTSTEDPFFPKCSQKHTEPKCSSHSEMALTPHLTPIGPEVANLHTSKMPRHKHLLNLHIFYRRDRMIRCHKMLQMDKSLLCILRFFDVLLLFVLVCFLFFIHIISQKAVLACK